MFVVLGAALMITVSLGDMTAEIGGLATWVWAGIALVGALQCFLIGELASRFPDRAGGTAQFAYRALPSGSPSLGALSAWCYWLAWTPGIAINLLLASTYLQRVLLPGANHIVLAATIGIILYAVTACGLRLISAVNVALAVIAITVVGVVVVAPFFRLSALQLGELLPQSIPAVESGETTVVGLLLKWGFVATWAGYAGEMASTVCAEIRDPARSMKKVMSVSAGVSVLAFVTVPVALFVLIGSNGVANDPFEAFVEAGSAALGPSGGVIVGLGLVAVLVLAAEAFIIGSSRTIYQMAKDGHLPAVFGRVNKRGAPIGSVVWDGAVILLMLAVFGTKIIAVVAACTFGYLIVFVLLPLAYLSLRRSPAGHPNGHRLGRVWVVIAAGLFVVNAALLVFGGSQWGLSTVLVGVGTSLVILPISALTRRFAVSAKNPAPNDDEETAVPPLAAS